LLYERWLQCSASDPTAERSSNFMSSYYCALPQAFMMNHSDPGFAWHDAASFSAICSSRPERPLATRARAVIEMKSGIELGRVGGPFDSEGVQSQCAGARDRLRVAGTEEHHEQ
jgi:hypothetical protein